LLLTVADDGVPAGPGVFRVFVDAGNAVQEVSEDNNVLMEYIYVRP
jgi:subtilase family serine protease